MGPSGCGKTKIGVLLSKKFSIPFIEGENFHSKKNKEKMGKGIPLEDEDRWPWLELLCKEINKNKYCVVACSALKKTYRDILRKSCADLKFIYLKGDQELIFKRVAKRKNHFFKENLVHTQFELLEEPSKNENAIFISIQKSPEEICQKIISSILDDPQK